MIPAESPSPAPEGIVSKASRFPVAETVDRLEATITATGLTIFDRIDHSDEAARVGLTMHPAHVLLFGSPRAGTPLMVASPLLALELPLRTLVWQDAAGKVWVSYTSPAYLAARYAIPDALLTNIAGIEGVVAAALAG